MAKIINATQARANFDNLIDETAQNHEPIIITGKRNNVVMICEKDWKAIQDMIGNQILNQRIDVIKSGNIEVAKKLNIR